MVETHDRRLAGIDLSIRQCYMWHWTLKLLQDAVSSVQLLGLLGPSQVEEFTCLSLYEFCPLSFLAGTAPAHKVSLFLCLASPTLSGHGESTAPSRLLRSRVDTKPFPERIRTKLRPPMEGKVHTRTCKSSAQPAQKLEIGTWLAASRAPVDGSTSWQLKYRRIHVHSISTLHPTPTGRKSNIPRAIVDRLVPISRFSGLLIRKYPPGVMLLTI
ncbi:hypothetical protein BJX64DRAFT_67436 [Aspergillus heterothallicus]